MNRRRFGQLLGSSAVAGGLPALAKPALAQAKAKVVVVGGGVGGATAAKYIARDAGRAVSLTLVEPAKQYVSPYHSNFYLGGLKPFAELVHSYDKLATFGIALKHQTATAINRDKQEVRLDDGSTLAYDRLVLSPGVDLKYDSVPGWGKEHEEAMPHAWKGDAQTTLLKKRLDAVPDGGLILILAPPNPSRCPPAPYERASIMAHALKKTGRTKCKIVILDPKPSFAMQALFQEGWERHYPGMIEWIDADIYEKIDSVDPATNSVTTGFETYTGAALVNVIPAQMAGAIAREAGLADQTGFCPTDHATMRSAADANIYIVGDACASSEIPRSASAAHSQGKVAAMMVLSDLSGSPAAAARYTNSCWSFIDSGDTVKVGGKFEARDGKIAAIESYISNTGEAPELRKRAEDDNAAWYASINADIFG